MDRLGRVPVLVAGFGVGAAGCGLAALGSARGSALAVLAGLAGVGTANGATLLARTAAGDMYPPQRRAAASPWCCSARCSARSSDRPSSAPCWQDVTSGAIPSGLWLAGAGFELAGLALVAAVRPDRSGSRPSWVTSRRVTAPGAPIGEVLRRPGVAGALVAAQASWAVMVAVMTLTGAVVVDHFGHEHHDVFPIIGAHRRHVRAGDRGRRPGGPDRAGPVSGHRPARDGPVRQRPAVGGERPCDRGRAVRPGTGLESLVRRGHGGARRPDPAMGARQPARLQRPAVQRDRRRPGSSAGSSSPPRSGVADDRRRGPAGRPALWILLASDSSRRSA